MVQDTPSRKLDQYIVRFPDGMRDQLKKAAKENNRSLNAEIIARLEGYEELKKESLILPRRLQRRLADGARINGTSILDEVISTLEKHYKLPDLTVGMFVDSDAITMIMGKEKAEEFRQKVASGQIDRSAIIKIQTEPDRESLVFDKTTGKATVKAKVRMTIEDKE